MLFQTGSGQIFPVVREQYGNVVPERSLRRRSNFGIGDRPHTGGWFVYDPRSVRRGGRGDGANIESESVWYSHVYDNGIIEIVTVIDPIGLPEDVGPKEFLGEEIEQEIVGTLDRAALTYTAIGMTAPARVMVSLVGVAGNRLIRSHAGHSQGFDRAFVELPELILEKVEPPFGRALPQLLDDLWRAAGWHDGSPSYVGGNGADISNRSFRRDCILRHVSRCHQPCDRRQRIAINLPPWLVFVLQEVE